MSAFKSAAITPSAARLTESLRDIGYDFPAAVADIVDNSIMAGASRVDIVIEFDGEDSSVVIADDGRGMTANGLIEALRYGSRRDLLAQGSRALRAWPEDRLAVAVPLGDCGHLQVTDGRPHGGTDARSRPDRRVG